MTTEQKIIRAKVGPLGPLTKVPYSLFSLRLNSRIILEPVDSSFS
jgi:hypothetical protein